MSSVLNPLFNFAQAACNRLFELKEYREPVLPPAVESGNVTMLRSRPPLRPRLIAHRGAWDHFNLLENTMPAFLEAQRLGAWGIEFDVRFTKDDVAIICHDRDLKRCFKQNENVCDVNADGLPKMVCRLDEVLALRGVHFMIEIKEKLNARKLEVLRSKLQHLVPVEEYHLLALDSDVVTLSPSTPAKSWILVGEIKTEHLIRKSVEQNLGGVAGHYALVTKSKVEVLHRAGQVVGTGFLPTKNILNREWQRGVDWVFTNNLRALV